jgi:WD40 repeat protein
VKQRKILLITIVSAMAIAPAGLWLALHLKAKPDRPLRIWIACFAPDGKTIISTGGTQSSRQPPDACEVLRWDARTGKRRELLHQAATVRSMVWSPDGKFVVLGDWGGATKLMDPATGRIIGFLTPHSDLINSVAVSADSKVVASACVDGTLTVCDSTGKNLDTFTIGGDRFQCVSLAPDGGSLVAGMASGKAYMHRIAAHDEPLALAAYPGQLLKREHRVEAVAYSPDGRSVVTGCESALRLWDSANGRMIREWNAGSGTIVNYAVFSPDGNTLATIDSGGMLALWNPATGDQINWTSAHPCTSFSISFSADGRRIATVGRDDYTLNIWDAQTLARVASFHRKVNP